MIQNGTYEVPLRICGHLVHIQYHLHIGTLLPCPARDVLGLAQAVATFDITTLPAGQYNVTAIYLGDGNYTASSSTSKSLTLVSDFTIADRGFTSQTVVAGRNATYVNDLGITQFFRFNGSVNVSCTVPAKGTTCRVDPATYATTSGPGVGTITITTTAHGTAIVGNTSNRKLSGWPFLAAALFTTLLLR
jgi:hypothetical protein